MRVCFYTLGCKVNQNETGALAQLFEQNGFTVVEEKDGADVYVVNSCTVTNFGDQKSRKWLRICEGRRWLQPPLRLLRDSPRPRPGAQPQRNKHSGRTAPPGGIRLL